MANFLLERIHVAISKFRPTFPLDGFDDPLSSFQGDELVLEFIFEFGRRSMIRGPINGSSNKTSEHFVLEPITFPDSAERERSIDLGKDGTFLCLWGGKKKKKTEKKQLFRMFQNVERAHHWREPRERSIIPRHRCGMVRAGRHNLFARLDIEKL